MIATKLGTRLGTLHQGDCLDVLRVFPDACVDLVYMDPPFFTQGDWGEFDDRWESMEQYVGFLRARVVELRRVLKPAGALWLHCDPTASHHMKLMLDGVLGRDRFLNEVIWQRANGQHDGRGFGRVDDRLLLYASRINRDAIREPLSREVVRARYRHTDNRGRYYAGDLKSHGLSGGGYSYDFHGHPAPWRCPEETMLRHERQGRIRFPRKRGGVPQRKYYLHEHGGLVPSTIWSDVKRARGRERTGYPTQKPLRLLERIIKAGSDPGGFVLDPFCGLGTTLVAARNLGRKAAGIDRNPEAIRISRERTGQGVLP